jgi:putative transposase
MLGLLNSERFANVAPAAIYATLLDEGRYHGSIRTVYRLLAARNQTGERCRQRVHPVYAKPGLLAVRPEKVWSWDITKIKGAVKSETYRIYVIMGYFQSLRRRLDAGRARICRARRAVHRRHDPETQHRPSTLALHAHRGTSMRLRAWRARAACYWRAPHLS